VHLGYTMRAVITAIVGGFLGGYLARR
jgi:hypothetical protein